MVAVNWRVVRPQIVQTEAAVSYFAALLLCVKSCKTKSVFTQSRRAAKTRKAKLKHHRLPIIQSLAVENSRHTFLHP